ncbi:MAG: hypothetical protein Ct9H90mP23_1060 [Methanobacteriota archaeon]|nr:MAG: hypothetical protein Ct9H90mP23_1060 [Euryarchaeota archaeon]
MTAMQIYYSLMKLDEVNDVVFVNGELPAYMRAFIDDKLGLKGLKNRLILHLFHVFSSSLFREG